MYGIKNTVTFSEFCDAWYRFEDRRNSFSYAGKRALFDYLEQLADDIGEDIELDIVALDCDYTEYDSAWEAMMEYQPEDMPCEGEEGDDLEEIEEKNEKAALEWLQDRTQVITVDGGGVIIQAF